MKPSMVTWALTGFGFGSSMADCGWYQRTFQGSCPTRLSDEGFSYMFKTDTAMWYNVFGGRLGSADALTCM